MNLTNKLNLPAPLVAAIANDPYDGERRSDYSTTSLIRPPRILALQRKHRDKLSEDVSDRIWALWGQVVHGIIERAATDELVEKRLFMEVAGKTVSGQIDLYMGRILWDWKVTTIHKGKKGAQPEWVQQGNINRLLCHMNGIEVAGIQYVALYRDWSLMKASREPHDYPQKAVEVFELPLWPLDVTRGFVEGRIALHEAAKVDLPLCTMDERWEEPTRFALMQKGKKRALKLYDTEAEAEAAITDPKKQYVEYRPGEPKRCLFFCSVAPHCAQHREYLMEKVAA